MSNVQLQMMLPSKNGPLLGSRFARLQFSCVGGVLRADSHVAESAQGRNDLFFVPAAAGPFRCLLQILFPGGYI